MNYEVNSFTPKKFASRYDKLSTTLLASTGGDTLGISDVSDLDNEGNLLLDTATNKWELIYYSSKDDLANTVTIPAWGRALRGNAAEHVVGTSIRVAPSAETYEYFERNYPLIQQGQIIHKTGLDIKILPLNSKMGSQDINYAGEETSVPNNATTYFWIGTDELLDSGVAYPTISIIKLGHIVAASGAIATIYDDRLLNYATNIVDAIVASDQFSIPNLKAVIDYVASYISGKISTTITTPTDDYVPTIKAVMDYMTAISAGVISVNGTSGVITLAEGSGVTIVESPDGTFTFSSAGMTLAAGSNITITESPAGTFTIASTYTYTPPSTIWSAITVAAGVATMNLATALNQFANFVANTVMYLTGGTEGMVRRLKINQDSTGSRTIIFKVHDNDFVDGDVNTTDDTIVVDSDIPTATPIIFTGAGLPAPLVAGTKYYAIRHNATTIKVATTKANAMTPTAVDITTVGSGTRNVYSKPLSPNGDDIILTTTAYASDEIIVEFNGTNYIVSAGNFNV